MKRGFERCLRGLGVAASIAAAAGCDGRAKFLRSLDGTGDGPATGGIFKCRPPMF